MGNELSWPVMQPFWERFVVLAISTCVTDVAFNISNEKNREKKIKRCTSNLDTVCQRVLLIEISNKNYIY